jgi:poly-beta-1,6-N-acetyl-D-glucosamine synthase
VEVGLNRRRPEFWTNGQSWRAPVRDTVTSVTAKGASSLTLAAAVVFLNEEEFLPRMLTSLERQERRPDLLLLVDDGSDDRSWEIAAEFVAERPYARVHTRPRRPSASDRLVGANELIAFQSALVQLDREDLTFDVYAKLDADLDLPPDFFARIMRTFEDDLDVGIAGSPLSVPGPDGVRPELSKPWHVRGATKFYRRDCLRQIGPLPAILGWDTIDETRAEMNGFSVRSIQFSEQPPLHLRHTGSYDGMLRGFRRRGVAAWGYGAHPLHVLVSVVVRIRHRPRVIGAAAYLTGWLEACLRRGPRVEPAARSHLRRRQLERLRAALAR